MSLRFLRVLGLVAGALPFLLTTGACEQEQSIGALVDDYVDVSNAQLYTTCDCWQEWGEQSRSECMGDDELLPAQRRCIEGALERDEEAARTYLECVLPLEEEFLSCLENRLVCDESDGAEACAEDFDIGYQNCIELPPAVERAWADCFSSSDS